MAPPAPDEIIHLNVGGTIFSTTRSTLTSPFSTPSMLSAMLNPSSHMPTRRDEHDRLFIDRDGERFRVLLNYLRSGTVHVVDGVVPCGAQAEGDQRRWLSLSEVAEEARFFGLETLCRRVEEELRRIELEEELSAISATSRLRGTLDRGETVSAMDKERQNGGAIKSGVASFGSPTSARHTARIGLDEVRGPTEVGATLGGAVREYQFTLDADF